MGLKEIFRDGMQESRRRKAVGKGKKDFQGKERLLGDQYTALGQKAWESKCDISNYGNIHDTLTNSQRQEDEQKARLDELQKQKQALEEQKKQENEKFDSQRKEVEEKKKGVDSRLNEEKNNLKATQKELDQANNRLSSIPKEREQLNKKLTDPATQEPARTEANTKLENLGKEEDVMKTQSKDKTEAVRALNEKIAPIQEESNQLQKQIDDIKAEQKKVIGELDKNLGDNKKETDSCNSKLKEIDKEKKAQYKQLGDQMAAANTTDPAVTTELTAIRTTQKEMSDINSEIGNLEGQQSEAGAKAHKQMIMIIVGGVLLVIAIIVALVILLTPKKPQNPFEQMMSESGAPKDAAEGFGQMMKGFEGLAKQSETQQGKTIVVAPEGTLKSALPNVGGWEMNSSYNTGSFGNITTSAINATYMGPNSQEVTVDITDAGTAAALLAPIKMLFSMNVAIDNEQEYQKISTYNNIPVAERFDKQSKNAEFSIIIKDRYIVNLQTTGDNGLEVLKNFMSKMDLSKLQ